MKTRLILFLAALVMFIASPAIAQPLNQPKVSADEQKAAQAIAPAADSNARLKAATDFIKKYPKSALRPQVARGMANQISSEKDVAQRITLAQSYQGAFTEPAEQELIVPIIIEALSQSKRSDEAFSIGAALLTKNPNSLAVLVQLVATGTDEAKAKNGKFVPQSIQYGTHAIQIIEGDKKPAEVDDTGWAAYKKDVLPGLYQSVGLLNLVKGDSAQARAGYLKAAEITPSDPFNFVMLAGILNNEYQSQAQRYKTMPGGDAREVELKKAQTMLDAVIDAYAHAIALSEGNAALQQVRQQYLQDLEAYYKYRHNNSMQGMQQLIDKYKVAAKP
jgi:hypothetical protein